MNSHHIAHYSIAAVLAAGLAYSGAQLRHAASIDDVPPTYHVASTDLASIPFGSHRWIVIAHPGSGHLPLSISAAANATLDNASDPHSGIWVSPDNADGHAVADALAKIIHEPVKVGDFPAGEKAYGTAYMIGIGTPQ